MRKVDYSVLTFALVVLATLIVYYQPFLSGSSCFYWGDHNAFFEPLCRFLGAAYAQGVLAMWNPYMGCGQSQIAIASPGVFYPGNLLFAFMPYTQGVAVQMVLHQFLSAIAGFLIVRRLGWGFRPAFVCGAIIGLNGYMFGLVENFTLVWTATWFLVAVYFLLLCTSDNAREAAWGIAGGTVAVALMLVAARPEVFVPGAAILLALACHPFLRNGFSRDALRCSIFSVAPLVCGALVAMPAVLPAAQWAAVSPRAQMTAAQSLQWSASWYDFVSMVFAQPFGDIAKMGNTLYPLINSVAGRMPIMPSAFIGTAAASLALASLFDRGWKWRWCCLGGAVAIVAILAGHNLPVLPLLLKLSPAVFVRYPIKLACFLIFLLALMAARGTYLCFVNPDAGSRAFLVCVGIWGVLGCFGVAFVLMPEFPWFGLQHFFAGAVGKAAGSAVLKMGTAVAIWSAVGVLTSAGCAVVCHAVRTKQYKRVGWCMQLAVALTLLGSLTYVAFAFNRFAAPARFYEQPSYVGDVIRRGYHSPVPPRLVTLTPLPLSVPANYHQPGEPMNYADGEQFARQLAGDNTCLDFGVGSLFPYEGSLTLENQVLSEKCMANNSQSLPGCDDVLVGRVAQMSGTGFAVSQILRESGVMSHTYKPLPLLNSKYFTVLDESQPLNARVYKTVDPLPFAYFISNWRVAPSDKISLAAILSAPRNGFDPHRFVVLNGRTEHAGELASPPVNEPTVLIPIEPEQWRYDRIKLNVTARQKGIVVVNDSFYPGWKALIDGKESPVFRANALFKAVVVAPGRHTVEFLFQPDVLRASYLLSAIGAILAVGAALLAWRLTPQQINRGDPLPEADDNETAGAAVPDTTHPG